PLAVVARRSPFNVAAFPRMPEQRPRSLKCTLRYLLGKLQNGVDAMFDWLKVLACRIHGLLARRELDKEFQQELDAHLEMLTEENIRQGLPVEEARRAARLRLGGTMQLQETHRELYGLPWLETLFQDLRYGLRQLRRDPGFTAIAVITLALGIGANTAIFSVVNAVLIRPLPFRSPDRLVQLWETEAAPGTYPFAGPDYLDWQAQNHTLAGSSLYTWQQSVNASGAGEPEQVSVVRTQANFFRVLGVEPLLGRAFIAGEDQAGQDRVAILSFDFWQRHFGGRRDALGKTLELNFEKYTVVGVMPASFRLVGEANIWVPQDMTPQGLGMRGSHNYLAIGRLKPGVTLAQARAELETIAKRLERQYPKSNDNVGAAVIPLKEELVGNSRPELLIMLGVVGLVLLIACANVANLLQARAVGRQREIAVRRALGAASGRIVRQLLTESVVLSLAGGACGLALAWAGVKTLAASPNLPIPQPHAIRLDGMVLLFTLVVSLLVGIFFGLVPAWRVSQLHLNDEIKSRAAAARTPTGERRLLRDALVVAEIGTSLVVLISVGLLLRSFIRLRETRVGVEPKGVLTACLVLPAQKYVTTGQIGSFYQRLLDRLRRSPRVKEAAISTELPLNGGSNGYITIPGNPNAGFQKILVEWNYVTPNYFKALGIPFFKGRNFTEQDSQDTAEGTAKVDAMVKARKFHPLPGVEFPAIINQTMAKTFWPSEEALGQVFKLGGIVNARVIGIAGDVNEWGIREPVIPEAYWPLTGAFDEYGRPMIVTLKSRGNPSALTILLRDQVHALDNGVALFRVRTMAEVISEATGGARYRMLLFGFFGLLALTLAAIGIYGVMAYTVNERTHEIGIRLALGAQKTDVLRLVVGQGMVLALIGVGIGIAAALGLTRLMASLLYGVKPTDPLTFVAVPLILTGVALLACYIPARRATKVDPMEALRYE
ncbi:MAG: ADOP family duplicated permease, partial [Terriglobia bacterium]